MFKWQTTIKATAEKQTFTKINTIQNKIVLHKKEKNVLTLHVPSPTIGILAPLLRVTNVMMTFTIKHLTDIK